MYHTIKDMTIQEKIQREELASLKGQFNYASDCLANRQDEMEPFEIKEFERLCVDYALEISELEAYINLVF